MLVGFLKRLVVVARRIIDYLGYESLINMMEEAKDDFEESGISDNDD